MTSVKNLLFCLMRKLNVMLSSTAEKFNIFAAKQTFCPKLWQKINK